MTFQSLSSRIASLPLVLAGPLLRRTEKDNVTVWLALKAARTVTLNVYGQETIQTAYLSGSGQTVKIGANLHIVAVTATSLDGRILLPDTTYAYSLVFADSNGNNQNLEDAGVMHAAVRQHHIYTYAPALPTFSLPPSDIKDLRLIHVSCRKPHGGKVDAFVAIDNILTESFANSSDVTKPLAKTRPHQLFHTGDQIYADDVDDTLLYMLNDASKALLGWNEELPLGVGDTPGAFLSSSHINDVIDGKDIERLPDELLPGGREDIVITNGFSEGSSHLMTLGEYICMYLFTWSDVLWPLSDTDYPLLENVYPHQSKRFIKAYGFPKAIKVIENFRSTLPRVRKVLANVPNYMMCDDHEVTDDWFLNLRFTRKILGDNTYFPAYLKNQFTSRIIQNGLTAFALCQGWGNKPANFTGTTSNEATLLTGIDQLANEQGTVLNTWNTIGGKVLPYLAVDGDSHLKLSGGLNYNLQIDFHNYKVIVLDTRTQRRFQKKFVRKTSSADLMSMDSLNTQIPVLAQELPANIEFTLVVSPSPVLGHRFVEASIQESAFESFYETINLDRIVPFELPDLFSEPLLEIAYDKEGWAFSRTIYQDVLHRLATYRKVIMLSGDVHYSFSGQIDYWNERNTVPVDIPPTTSKLVQLTASPSKNSDWVPSKGFARFFSYHYNTPIVENSPILNSLPTLEFIGWQNSGYHVEKRISYFNEPYWKSSFIKGYPEAYRFKKKSERVTSLSQAQVQWRYRMSFAEDKRPADQRATQADLGDTISNTILKAAELHQDRGDKDLYRMAVGDDTIGELTFYEADSNGTTLKGLKHSLWYNTAINPEVYPNEFLPYTIHDFSLALPPVSGPTVPGYEE